MLCAILAWALFTYSSVPAQTSEDEPGPLNFEKEYAIFSLPIPEGLSFAGERVPIERTYIREDFDRELLVNTYWQSSTLLLIKRANRYFPDIEAVLAEQGVPDDFKYLAAIESSLMPRAVSPAGAVGLWQIMRGTAHDYGLQVDSEVDERYHIKKSTLAACKYLKSAREKFGSWTLAAAAYNAGRASIIRQLDRQKIDNYYDLLLGEETGRYIYRILAVKEILSRPSEYGFYVKTEDLYPAIPTYSIEVKGRVDNFADFAMEHGITYRELKDLNPWLRDGSLSNTRGKTFQIDLPVEGAFHIREGDDMMTSPSFPTEPDDQNL